MGGVAGFTVGEDARCGGLAGNADQQRVVSDVGVAGAGAWTLPNRQGVRVISHPTSVPARRTVTELTDLLSRRFHTVDRRSVTAAAKEAWSSYEVGEAGNVTSDLRGGSRRSAIIEAALEVFASRGCADATFQVIAHTAGVSVGAIQHHFGSKERLIEAVDTHVLQTIGAVMSQPEPAEPAEVGQRVRLLFEAHLPVLDYVARQLVDDGPVGRAVFDAMAAAGVARWERLAEIGATPEGLDTEWAGLNPLILVLGAIILRRHLDRRWPEGFTTERQLSRWEDAMNVLISRGQLRQ